MQLCTSRRDDLSGQIVESCFEVEVVKEKIHFQEEVLLTAHKFKWEVLRQFSVQPLSGNEGYFGLRITFQDGYESTKLHGKLILRVRNTS